MPYDFVSRYFDKIVNVGLGVAMVGGGAGSSPKTHESIYPPSNHGLSYKVQIKIRLLCIGKSINVETINTDSKYLLRMVLCSVFQELPYDTLFMTHKG